MQLFSQLAFNLQFENLLILHNPSSNTICSRQILCKNTVGFHLLLIITIEARSIYIFVSSLCNCTLSLCFRVSPVISTTANKMCDELSNYNRTNAIKCNHFVIAWIRRLLVIELSFRMCLAYPYRHCEMSVRERVGDNQGYNRRHRSINRDDGSGGALWRPLNRGTWVNAYHMLCRVSTAMRRVVTSDSPGSAAKCKVVRKRRHTIERLMLLNELECYRVVR